MTPELETFYRHWLEKFPSVCRPHFYNLSHERKTVFLMDKPLERLSPQPRSDVVRYVEACRLVLLDWLAETQDLWNPVARALPQNAVGAKLTDFRELLQHVYFTDCVKCEATTKDRKHHEAHASQCTTDEFALLRSSALFIVVGGEAWNTIRGLVGPFSPVPWNYQHLKSALPMSYKSNLTDVHGVLFKNASTGKFVIPVAFPGGHTNPLRNSYVEYLKDGLAAFSQATA